MQMATIFDACFLISLDLPFQVDPAVLQAQVHWQEQKKNGCLKWIRNDTYLLDEFPSFYVYIYIYLFPFCFWSQGLDINFQCLEKTEDSVDTFCWMITGKAAAKRAAGEIWRCFVGDFI